jgi:hypothetical protein
LFPFSGEERGVSEMCFLYFRIPDDGKVQTPSDSKCYTPLSEPFKIYSMLNRAQIVFCYESKKTKSNVLGQWKNTITFQQLMNLDVNSQPDARHNYYVPGSSRSSNCSNGRKK